MRSRIAEALGLKLEPVAILLSNTKPDEALQFKEGGRGCVAAIVQAAAKGRTGVFTGRTCGCPGGVVGLGFGNYGTFPINRLLSTGGVAQLPNGASFDMHEGERFFADPATADRWTQALPYRNVPSELRVEPAGFAGRETSQEGMGTRPGSRGQFVVCKPLDGVDQGEDVSMVLMFANPDQLSALVTLAGFRRGSVEAAFCPWGAACQSILFAYAEAEKENPRGVIGFFDISQRSKIDKDLLSFTMPHRLFVEMEANVDASFLGTDAWQKLRERW